MDPIDPTPFVQSIRELASRAARTLPPRSPAGREARARVRRPVDYMRCAEFTLASAQLSIAPGMSVLDVASPQWFSLLLASRFPGVRFDYVNILDEELGAVREVAACLGLENICYHRQDVRALSFPAGHFDRAITISVIEHIAPEVGGDVLALEEVRRA